MNNDKLIQNVLEQYYSCFCSRRWSDFEQFLDDAFIYCTDNCITQRKREFIDHLRRHDWLSASFSIKMISVFDFTEAITAVYEVIFKGTSNNEKMSVKALETTVFLNDAGAWRILTCHSSNTVTKEV